MILWRVITATLFCFSGIHTNLTLQLFYNSISRITTSAEAWTTHLLTNKQQALGSYQAFIKLIGHRNPA